MDDEVWCGVSRGPSIFQGSTIHKPGSEWTPAEPPTSHPIPVSGTHAYGGGPTGPSGISFPTAMYAPTRRTAAEGGGGGGGGGQDSPPPDRSGDRDRRGGTGGNGNG